jgi:outer membrane lipoprotein carrier protein
VSPIRRVLLAGLLAACVLPVRADGLGALEAFLRDAKSGRADFTQVVTSPARDGQAPRAKQSTGSFAFQRPNRFRFNYRKPFEQVIVADGQTLWLHDVDLNQVTARKQAQALGATPAALIASAADLATLRQDFELANAPDQGGLQWVQATPRAKEGQLRAVRAGFRGNELAALEILDGFGQRSVLTFSRMDLNVALPADTFQFRPPAGADVVRQ